MLILAIMAAKFDSVSNTFDLQSKRLFDNLKKEVVDDLSAKKTIKDGIETLT